MWYYIFFVCCFLGLNYNILSIWFSFFLNLSCYLVPFLWENNFFFCILNPSVFLFSSPLSYCFCLSENIFPFFLNLSDSFFYSPDFFYTSSSLNSSACNYYLLCLESSISRKHLIDFYSLQKQQILVSGETSLSFYRVYNKSLNDILFYSIYVINPPSFSLFLVKVQCFCFEEILIGKKELIDLPILIYLDTTVLSETVEKWIPIIYLEYVSLIRQLY